VRLHRDRGAAEDLGSDMGRARVRPTLLISSRSGKAVSVPGFAAAPLRASALVVTVAVVALTLASISAAPAADAPRATEIGVTDRELHIAVVADVDTPLAPGLFGGSVD